MKAIGELLRRSGLEALHAKVREGRRLDFDDGMRLYRTPDLTAVGYLANLARERRSGDRTYFRPQPAHQLHQHLQQALQVLFVLHRSQ